MYRTMVIFGNHGKMTVDRLTGDVLELDTTKGDEKDAYADILCFDLGEWRATYPNEECAGGDILDFGFWTTKGEYFGPEDEWRAEILPALKDGSLRRLA